jgi:ABC-type multidrug transport system fused ATPase/permease subunit
LLDRKPLIEPPEFDHPVVGDKQDGTGEDQDVEDAEGISHNFGNVRMSATALRVPEISAKQSRMRQAALTAAVSVSQPSFMINFQGEIEFCDVFFSYPTRPGVSVLNGLSFKARAQETIAIVGASGCGKSTVMSLIERLYDFSAG